MVASRRLLNVVTFQLPLLLWFGVFFSQSGTTQAPIQITVNVMPPYPNYADKLIEMGDQTIIRLQNTDMDSGYSLKLGVKINGDNGIIVRSKENALPNQSIDLMAGETVVLTGEELNSYYNTFTENDFDFVGITRADTGNKRRLPDGAYKVCMRAYDFNTGMPLSAASPQGCSPAFTVVTTDPPIITYPHRK